MPRQLLVRILISLSAFTCSYSRADWPEFRGPSQNGHVPALSNSKQRDLPLTWSESQNVRWKTAIPERGWATPVVMNGQIWLATATEDGHDFYAICIDDASGKILHNKHLFHCDSPEPLGNNTNCYAACSPAIEPGRVYVHFGSYGTACVDTATGNILWKRDDLRCRHYRGPSSSVVLFENLVILTFDGVDLEYTVALDKRTGQNVWRTPRDVVWNDENLPGRDAAEAQRIRDGDHRKAHSTPILFTDTAGREQLFSVGAKAAFAYDPRTGRELWRVHFDDFSVAPRPIYHDGIVYMVTGITHPELWAVRTDGTGDATDMHVLWRLASRVAKTASPVLVDDLIYMISDDGILNCIDAKTSKAVYSHRLGGRFAASPIYTFGEPASAGGPSNPARIYFSDQDGKTAIIKPGRKFELLATNTLEDGCMASLAADAGTLYLRTKTHLYRIENANATRD
jgi:outer membrane protein assembly factor BamB